MKAVLKVWFLSLTLLVAPLSVVWGAPSGKEPSQIAKTAAKVSLPAVVNAKAKVALQIKKDKEALRKSIIAKKMQRKGFKLNLKKGSNKGFKKKSAQRTQQAQTIKIPARMGIRTWTYPETASARTNKIVELSARIKETENLYDAEHGRFQKLNKECTRLKGEVMQSQKVLENITEPQIRAMESYRQAQTQALNNPQMSVEPQRREYLKSVEKTAAVVAAAEKVITVNSSKLISIEAQLTLSKNRLQDIVTQLDALHHHRTDVSDVVFLRSVRD